MLMYAVTALHLLVLLFNLFTVFTASTVVHEFAFFCLSSLAVDFSAKITIAEKGSLPLLVRGLSSSDPDIQRNSAETLALVLQVAYHTSDYL